MMKKEWTCCKVLVTSLEIGIDFGIWIGFNFDDDIGRNSDE